MYIKINLGSIVSNVIVIANTEPSTVVKSIITETSDFILGRTYRYIYLSPVAAAGISEKTIRTYVDIYISICTRLGTLPPKQSRARECL